MASNNSKRLQVGLQIGIIAALVLMLGATDSFAQVIPLHAHRFIGVWDRAGDYERGNCGDLIDGNGVPRNNCALPVDQLPLNQRAYAWIEFFDEALGPNYECAAHTYPTLLGDVRLFEISLKTDSIIMNHEMANQIREIWMDGRGHPPATDLFYNGHSIGRWDSEDLVVESTNFTFDPDGMDDHAHLPTSVRKKLTERYTLTDPDTLLITITLEDSLFLTEPFTWTHKWVRTDEPMDGWWDCDPEVTRREVELNYIPKYADD